MARCSHCHNGWWSDALKTREITPKQMRYILDLLKIREVSDEDANTIKNKLFTQDAYWASKTIHVLKFHREEK